MYQLIALCLLLLSLPLQAQQVEIRGTRIWTAPDRTRLVLDIATSVPHKIFPLENPHRLVIDIPDARLKDKLPVLKADEPLLIGIRSGVRAGNDLRLVLDLKKKVRAKSFLLKPNERYGHRLVVDLAPAGKGMGKKATGDKPRPTPRSRLRDIVVAIDAGHGGEDPGAVGAAGTKEKVITLQIAHKLARLVKKEWGMRPVLIRKGDYFLRLRKRIQLARKQRADLFVSIHADAFRDRRVRGSSIYTLSHRGASSEAAKWLADKENSADLMLGIDLNENDALLATVLLDMTQNATLEHSNLAANRVLAKLRKVGVVHKNKVQKAGFVVLKAPDIPSMLIETAFISNPEEEKRLRSKAHQAKLANAILAGIKSYFTKYSPPGTKFARGGRGPEHSHVIGSGETLLEIARHYDVSLTSLRKVNDIHGDRIRAGQTLTIPGS
ncbi:MAG: N-acetylmuramoyl-L-alanine amidase [Candidatus Thiosymbion ectosymbiont of Robbea hypermnestra]|nr:N-acetylmuramoyl-L-alanine amidase [Candidatus Thiosymbion ectosymbiont of Robbea hypermnestra]